MVLVLRSQRFSPSRPRFPATPRKRRRRLQRKPRRPRPTPDHEPKPDTAGQRRAASHRAEGHRAAAGKRSHNGSRAAAPTSFRAPSLSGLCLLLGAVSDLRAAPHPQPHRLGPAALVQLLTAIGELLCLSRISLIFAASMTRVSGFCNSETPASSRPWWTMAFRE